MNTPTNFGTNKDRAVTWPEDDKPYWTLKCPRNLWDDPPYTPSTKVYCHRHQYLVQRQNIGYLLQFVTGFCFVFCLFYKPCYMLYICFLIMRDCYELTFTQCDCSLHPYILYFSARVPIWRSSLGRDHLHGVGPPGLPPSSLRCPQCVWVEASRVLATVNTFQDKLCILLALIKRYSI